MLIPIDELTEEQARAWVGELYDVWLALYIRGQRSAAQAAETEEAPRG